ncbi:MAG: glycosyltransferase [Flavobacteriales bacterium]|nr:MAG: glycosyltransferase [Flavobacteriales bacterium]PIE48988.1 MAG: glycosyltransferase [Flavobacteriales bacterium]
MLLQAKKKPYFRSYNSFTCFVNQDRTISTSFLFQTENCCVIIPTYNNEKTLKSVIEGVMYYADNIIVVNDGSTDNTKSILSDFEQIKTIHLNKNSGKGKALFAGFKKAVEMGYTHAITLDSDGQHFPDDLPLFIEELHQSKDKNILLVGSRNLQADGMPRKNSFANKFSNFWFWAITGKELSDTQSGFRLYPLEIIEKIKFYGSKFEFELEALVKTAWGGHTVKNVPIKVFYHPTERVSHYRPFKDFVRITAMNTYLFTVAVVYIKPKAFYKQYKKKGLKRFFLEDFLGSKDSSLKKSLSVALGTFIGMSPLWGFHTILAIVLAAVFRLNKVISFVFSNVSLPVFIPFIIYGSLKMGGWVLNKKFVLSWEHFDKNFDLKLHLVQYIVGSFVLATIVAVCFGVLSLLFLGITKKIKLRW